MPMIALTPEAVSEYLFDALADIDDLDFADVVDYVIATLSTD